jgi:hypothetical protein
LGAILGTHPWIVGFQGEANAFKTLALKAKTVKTAEYMLEVKQADRALPLRSFT